MKPTKLKNIYTGDIVYCHNINETLLVDEKVFIKVFSEDNPNRTFLVNKAAFNIIG
jgi:predicted RNA-binding protein with RPS1 domain